MTGVRERQEKVGVRVPRIHYEHVWNCQRTNSTKVIRKFR